jgi:hypothetical protein
LSRLFVFRVKGQRLCHAPPAALERWGEASLHNVLVDAGGSLHVVDWDEFSMAERGSKRIAFTRSPR